MTAKKKQLTEHRTMLGEVTYLVKSQNTHNKSGTYIETLFSEYLASKTEGVSSHEH